MQNNNIDRIDAAHGTRYPFQQQCSCMLGNIELPAEFIRTVRIGHVEGRVLPYRLSSVSVSSISPSCCIVKFSDSSGVEVGTWTTWLSSNTESDYLTSLIFDPAGALIGHVSFNKSLPGLMLSAARLVGGRCTTKTDDFILVPSCHVAWFSGRGKVLAINGEYTKNDIVVKPGTGIQTTSISPYSIGAAGVYSNDYTEKHKICVARLYEPETGNATSKVFWVGGRHLQLQAGLVSNLRVVDAGNEINLQGVSDG